jgi:hypothetical protein
MRFVFREGEENGMRKREKVKGKGGRAEKQCERDERRREMMMMMMRGETIGGRTMQQQNLENMHKKRGENPRT